MLEDIHKYGFIERGCNDDKQEMGESRALDTMFETAASADDDKLKARYKQQNDHGRNKCAQNI